MIKENRLEKILKVSNQIGLITFWNFIHNVDDIWKSYFAPEAFNNDEWAFVAMTIDPEISDEIITSFEN